ncbi:MAG: tetratricopeptide repeat protein [Pyrinomonadaceae bacterium]
MRIKNTCRATVGAVLLGVCAATASAQISQATGTITLKKADGTTVPAEGAQVTIHRTDIRGKYEVKTGKNGRYVYAGIPLVGTYTIVVSAPGARPTFLTDARFNSDKPYDFTLDPGDGSVITLEQIKAAGAGKPSGAPANNAEARRASEDMAKKQAELDATNKKITESNEQVQELLKVGNEAMNAKKYDEALTAYEQGIQARPDSPVFHGNKAILLNQRGVEKYQAAAKAKDAAGKEAAKSDFKNATESAEKAIATSREAAAQNSGGAQGQPQAAGKPSVELDLLRTRAESYRLALQTSTQVDATVAAKAIQEYVTAEVDPIRKAKAQASLGEALFQSGQVNEAVAAYQQILTSAPDNLDAMYGLGVALAGAAGEDVAKLTQARDMLEKFAQKAPDTHPKKAEATGMVQYLNDTVKAATSKPDPAAKPAKRKS